jgi:hypothetical protein
MFIPRLVHAAVVLGLCVSAAAWPGVAAADSIRWVYELDVETPQAVGDAFKLDLVTRIDGSAPGFVLAQPVETTFRLVATRPDGSERDIVGTPDHPGTASGNAPGAVGHSEVSLVPNQNGDWIFTVWQLDGGNKTIAVQRHVQTDKAAVSNPPDTGSSSGAAGAAPHLVEAIHLDPSQAVVGEPVTIGVQMGNQAVAQSLSEVPINVLDESGAQPLGTVKLAGGSGTFVWVPEHATGQALLQVGDQTVSITVLDTPAAPSSGASDDETPAGTQTDDAAGDPTTQSASTPADDGSDAP